MAAKSGTVLPPPPADLAQRKLPLKPLKGTAFRIHRAERNCLYFGKSASERFDDPRRRYGVLYAALQAEAAFAEVFLRHLSLMLIAELDLHGRALGEIACSPLHCVDLSAAGLRRLSCDNRIATEKPYQTTQQWSQAFFEHPQQPDGIIYRCRHNPQFKCVALFDRAQPRIKLVESAGLMGAVMRGWTVAEVKRYHLAVEPAL
jgi:RES domain